MLASTCYRSRRTYSKAPLEVSAYGRYTFKTSSMAYQQIESLYVMVVDPVRCPKAPILSISCAYGLCFTTPKESELKRKPTWPPCYHIRPCSPRIAENMGSILTLTTIQNVWGIAFAKACTSSRSLSIHGTYAIYPLHLDIYAYVPESFHRGAGLRIRFSICEQPIAITEALSPRSYIDNRSSFWNLTMRLRTLVLLFKKRIIPRDSSIFYHLGSEFT